MLTPSAAQGADISEALDMEELPGPRRSLRLKLYGPPYYETVDSCCVSFFLFPWSMCVTYVAVRSWVM